MTFDMYNISLKNRKAWDLIQCGHTAGVFQLESELGKQWASRIKPRNINELSAVLALIRPACLESGMTAQYAKIQNNQEPPYKFDDETIDRILSPTNGVLIYQEQLMKFGGEIAWKHLPHIERLVIVDKLRKGIGKKNAKLLSELRSKFIDGCQTNGRTEELAIRLFEMIENAGRYAFNDAHAKKYALWSYRTAYAKANFPLEFYAVYLTYSKVRQKPKEEIRNLVGEARMLGIDILKPCLSRLNSEFKIVENGNSNAIAFGLSHLKQVSKNDVLVLQENQDLMKSFGGLMLLHFDKENISKRLRSNCVESLIQSGCCDIYNISRSCMLEVFIILRSLTPKEIKFICNLLREHDAPEVDLVKSSIMDCGKSCSSSQRSEMVCSESDSVDLSQVDNHNKKLMLEKDLIGVEFSRIYKDNSTATWTCKDCFRNSKNNRRRSGSVRIKISEIVHLVTKKGRNPGREMCQIIGVDNTGSYRFACFPDEYIKIKDIIDENMDCILKVNGTGSGWCINSVKVL